VHSKTRVLLFGSFQKGKKGTRIYSPPILYQHNYLPTTLCPKHLFILSSLFPYNPFSLFATTVCKYIPARFLGIQQWGREERERNRYFRLDYNREVHRNSEKTCAPIHPYIITSVICCKSILQINPILHLLEGKWQIFSQNWINKLWF
jgi:hypothetical protein